jgi:hypothetical protein
VDYADTPAHYPTQYTPTPLGVGTPNVGGVYPGTPMDLGDTPGPMSPVYSPEKPETGEREVYVIKAEEVNVGVNVGEYYAVERETGIVCEDGSGPRYMIVERGWAPFDFGGDEEYNITRAVLGKIEGKYGAGGKWKYAKKKRVKRVNVKRKRGDSEVEEEGDEDLGIVREMKSEVSSAKPVLDVPKVQMGGGAFSVAIESWNVANVGLNETFRGVGGLDMISNVCDGQHVLKICGDLDIPMAIDVDMIEVDGEEEGELEELDEEAEKMRKERMHLSEDSEYLLLDVVEPLWRKAGDVRDVVYQVCLEIFRENVCLSANGDCETKAELERRVTRASRTCDGDLLRDMNDRLSGAIYGVGNAGLVGPLTIQQHLEVEGLYFAFMG